MERKFLSEKRNYVIGVFLLLTLLFVAVLIRGISKEKVILEYSDAYVAMAELPSQLGFAYYDEEGWKDKLKEINPKGSLDGKLTYGKLKEVLRQLSLQEYVAYEAEASWKDVPRKVWDDVYQQALDLLDAQERVSAKNLVILSEGIEETGEGSLNVLTQDGRLEAPEGIPYFKQYDMYQAYVMDGRIIGIAGECKDTVTWENVFVHTAREGAAEFLYERQNLTLLIPGLSEEITDTICDVVWKDRKVSAIYKKEDIISGKVLSFNEEKIEISGYGALHHSGNLKIYKTYGTVEELDESKLVIGNLQADFVVAKKDVCGIILKKPASIENIRVLLLNQENGIYHADPVFVADAGSTITVGNKKKKLKKDRLIRASEFFSGEDDYVKISLKKKSGRIYFANEAKEHISLGYRGTFEIRKYPEGYGIVNELPLEQYLYGVVPSEMPASYERAALCVQAVCARSYAYIHLMRNGYAAYGAHVDDSTNFQVYNKQAENPQTNLAVDDTVGEVIKYQGEVAEAYFFSTSCGYTGSPGVWNLPQDGANAYLKSICLLSGKEKAKEQESGAEGSSEGIPEEEFAAFIKDRDIESYDGSSPYFRWQAKLDVAGKLGDMNGVIAARFQANAENVQIQKADGTPGSFEDLAGFGQVTGIVAEKRDTGGAVRDLCISYEKGSVHLLTELNVRQVLGAAATEVADQEGNPVDMTMLPSAYCIAEPAEGGYMVYGGGYGHGLGMCQNGADGMAKAGMGYVEILMKFYQGITIENIYNGSE
ncbi:SpoIID/LytB domain-containing protein [Lachnospiraceae bacterium 29-84]